MRNLNLLPALKFHCTTKMEVVEEINRIRDDRLDFLETFEEHREALLLMSVGSFPEQRLVIEPTLPHVLKNTSAITAAVLGENYLRRIVETYFGLRDNITSMVDSVRQKF